MIASRLRAAAVSYPKVEIRDLMVAFVLLTSVAAATMLHAQTVSVVYNYASQANDPIQPYAAGILAQGRDGNLYSTTSGGGSTSFYGAAYKVSPAGVLSVVYNFGLVGGEGYSPDSGLTLGTDGNFYGAAFTGGSVGYGTVFKLTPGGVVTTLHNFTGSDGALPIAPPVQGTDGNLYGTTCPLCNGAPGLGSIYKVTTSGTSSLLYTCTGTDCENFYDPLVQGTDGNFYATSEYGGASGQGTIIKISPTGKFTVLYTFDGTHGSLPLGLLVQGKDGNFYGTTVSGGANNNGVVFKMTPAGKLTVLHNMNGTTDGGTPFAGLVQATDGNFYGANTASGAVSTNCPNGCGTVFRITPTGTFSVIYNFDQTTGQLPYTTLFQHTNGLLYGTTQSGGTGGNATCNAGNCGVLYSVNIGAAPFTSLMTTSGKVGKSIELLGQGFTGTTGVSFGGVAATFKVMSDTYLTTTVPSGAKSGSVTVNTPSGTLTSSKTFRVTPQLTSFTPSSGPVGTSVTITGVSLLQATKLTFGGIAATSFTVNSDTQITATVPTGALTGKIVITTPGGTASSTTNFTVN